MPDYTIRPITKEQRGAITAAAATLKEASDHLFSLAGSKMKDLIDAKWLIRQTHTTLHKLMDVFDIDT